MNIVISQPMFLPWAGLFEQMRLADIFVHYDDVALPQGRSFMSRVQIKTDRGQEWLTVPLQRASRHLIRDVLIDQTADWRRKHLAAYARWLRDAPFFAETEALLTYIYSHETDSLSSFNINALEKIAEYLNIKPRFVRSSGVGASGTSSEKILNLTQYFGGTCYITGHGAKNYLDHERLEGENIAVKYMDYTIKPYDQFHGAFTPYVTIIDGIAHKGVEIVNHFASKTIDWKDFVHG
jgi:hypothetical protein